MKDRESGVAKRKRNLTSQPNLVLCRAPLCWPRCWVRQIPQTALRRNGCGSLPICMLAFLSQAATCLRPIETTHMMLCTSRAETPWTPHDSIRQTLVHAGVEREIGTSAQPKSPSCIRSTWCRCCDWERMVAVQDFSLSQGVGVPRCRTGAFTFSLSALRRDLFFRGTSLCKDQVAAIWDAVASKHEFKQAARRASGLPI